MKLSQIYTIVSLKLQSSQPSQAGYFVLDFFLRKSIFHNETMEDLMKKGYK